MAEILRSFYKGGDRFLFFSLFNFSKMIFLLLRFFFCGFAPTPGFWFGQKVLVSDSDNDNSLGLIVGLEWREYRFDAPYPPLPLTDDQNTYRGWWYSVVINDRICKYPEAYLSTALDILLDKN